MKKLIFGLGNPGKKYEDTRHNIGQQLAKYAGSYAGVKFRKSQRLESYVASFDSWGVETYLAFSQGYMNLSGNSVIKAVRYFGIEPEKDLLVLFDDVALPFGKLRLRSRGGDSGHNGMRSVQQNLETQNFSRLRIGIETRPNGEKDVLLETFVLQSFTAQEKKALGDVLEMGLRACELWIKEPIDKAMNIVNAGDVLG